MIHAMIEVDVADARSALRSVGRTTGETPSFTGLIIACCARAVERTVDAASQVVPTIIRAANRKTVREMHNEIRAARTTAVEHSGVFSSMRACLLVPGFLRRLVFRVLDRMPHAMKQHAGLHGRWQTRRTRPYLPDREFRP
ncbi:MAG: hypothetical protein ACOC2N_04320 [Spirochaetota bacterium]